MLLHAPRMQITASADMRPRVEARPVRVRLQPAVRP